MLGLVISGGQTGADQGALFAARACGIATGGWVPKGWKTEIGPAPWLARYGLRESPSPSYPARTRRNVRDSDASILFGDPYSPGNTVALEAIGWGRHWLIPRGSGVYPLQVALWLIHERVEVLNVGGTRESSAPGIEAEVKRFLTRVFREVRKRQGAPILDTEPGPRGET